MNISKILGVRTQQMVTQEIPDNRMQMLQQSFRQRLSDSIQDLLYRACTDQDLRTASGLYAVLEDFHNRDDHNLAADRRMSDDILSRARREIDRCRQAMYGDALNA